MKPVLPVAVLLGLLPLAALTHASLADPVPAAPSAASAPPLSPPVSAISFEPFFADIVKHADTLKKETETFNADKPSLELLKTSAFKTYIHDMKNLSTNVMKGHLILKKRGTDNDLKCITMGLTIDLDIKRNALLASANDAELSDNLTKTASLLSDVHDVIVTPATTDSGLDCTLEFGDK
ncbi:MAG: hypothetical protein WBQ60_00825 [Asticcacaulis sp.]